ncbi:MAG TPA: choice-of-anchor D domain-containing protein [Candidatus Sulfotelmatobacter sp.]
MRTGGLVARFQSAVKLAFVLSLVGCLAPLASAQAVVSLSPTSLPFGNQQVGIASAPMVVTLTNTGNATLTLKKIQITGPNGPDFSQTNNCGTSVVAGGQCTFNVLLTASWTGARSGNLSLTDTAAGSPHLVPLSGTGLAPAVKFTPSSLTFANQTLSSSSATQNFTVLNNGQEPLNISSIAVAGVNPGDFSQTNNCGTSLAINATCTVTVTFTPTAAWGRTAAVWITDNALGSPHVAGIAGNGVSGGVVSFSPTSLTFATALMGTVSAAQTVTLSNPGTASLQIANIAAAGDYIQTNTCGTSVAAGGSCTISVKFNPTSTAARPGWIDVNLTDPAGIQTVALSGTGASPAPVLVKPRSASVTFTQTQQYTAYLSNVVTTNVTWYVDNIAGGNSTVGAISTSGLYTPPATAGSHVVKAVNIANTRQSASVPVVVSGYAGTVTHHNDTFRTGQNSTEAALTTGNIAPAQFGKIFKYTVDGQIYTEPLWVPNLTISGVAHNVVFVATQHDSVYAFDADNATLYPNPLWQTSFINPTAGITSIPRADIEKGLDINPEIGVTATPVIDVAKGVIFVEARSKDTSGTVNCPGETTSQYFHYLHALDITTGAEKPGSPVMICAQVPGTGYDNVSGTVTFNSMRQNSRAGLLLLNGSVFMAFSSLEDINPYHGWILGYDETTLAPTFVYNATPNGNKAGVWHGGGGIPADASGNIYYSTGTGSFDSAIGGGISFVKVSPNSGTKTLAVSDYFSPYNQAYLNVEAINLDLSSSGPMLLPDQPGTVPHEAIVAGKTGTVYLVNRDNMGHFSPTSDNVVQTLYTTIGGAVIPTGNWGTPAYFNSQIYIQGVKDNLKQYGLSTYPGGTAMLSGTPLAIGADVIGYPGTTPAISSNGTQNGIVWVVQSDGTATNKPSTLRAYDAANIAHEIYNSGASGQRDIPGPAVKFAVPTVANGKVYVNTATELDVYGLLP